MRKASDLCHELLRSSQNSLKDQRDSRIWFERPRTFFWGQPPSAAYLFLLRGSPFESGKELSLYAKSFLKPSRSTPKAIIFWGDSVMLYTGAFSKQGNPQNGLSFDLQIQQTPKRLGTQNHTHRHTHTHPCADAEALCTKPQTCWRKMYQTA